MRWMLLVIGTTIAGPIRAAEPPDFNRDVRPILAARCFKCHGPDDEARKAKLRLDSRAEAEHVLGKPAESELASAHHLDRRERGDAAAVGEERRSPRRRRRR